MPLGATFDAQGGGFRQSSASFGDAVSLMDRAAQSRREDEMLQLQKEAYEVQKPVIQAKAQADIASYGNKITAGKQDADLVAVANIQMPDIRQQWHDSMMIKDPATRLATQDQILGDAGRFSSVPGISEEVKTWHDQFAQASINQRTLDTIAGRSEVADANNEAKFAQQQAMLDMKARELEHSPRRTQGQARRRTPGDSR